jgi:two-component system, LytTR family, sensor kinase
MITRLQLKTGFLVAVLFPGIFIFSLSEPSPTHTFIRFITSFLCILALWIICFSLTDFRTRPQKIKKTVLQRYGYIVLAFLLSIAVYLVVGFFIDQTGSMLSQVAGEKRASFQAWFFLCLRIALFTGLIMLIKYLFDSSKARQEVEMENEILKRENLNAQHETLKQQVNPHFLFNSLNTLRSLIKLDSNQAEDFASELSSVYRYMLRHQDKQQVTLREEIEFLQSYLYLLKIRFGESIQTQIQIPADHLDLLMPPNTLQLLIENAVKHNVISQKKPLSISLFMRDNCLVVENTLQPKAIRSASSHLGLTNIRSRYALLKGKDVTIQQGRGSFQVLLPV